jgi:hypothetical protein
MSQISPVIEKLLDKAIHILQNDNLKKKIELHLIQPFLQYSIELLLPYVIIVCVVFGILITMTISILCILVFRFSSTTTAAEVAKTVAAVGT